MKKKVLKKTALTLPKELAIKEADYLNGEFTTFDHLTEICQGRKRNLRGNAKRTHILISDTDSDKDSDQENKKSNLKIIQLCS